MKQLLVGVALWIGCGDGGSHEAAVPVDAIADAGPQMPPDGSTPRADFTVELTAPAVFSNHGAARAVVATATNHTTAELALTIAATGAFSPAADGACDHVAAGASCAITLVVDNAAPGARVGALAVTGNASTQTLAIATRVDAYVGAQVGPGQGTVAFEPAAEAGCIGGGCYAPDTAVTLTETPAQGYLFAGWGIAGCGAAPTCVVTASATPRLVAPSFTAEQSLALDITGGPGEVSVATPGTPFVSCRASCTLLVDPTLPLQVFVSTPVEFAGFDGNATSISGGTEATYPAGSSSIKVAFSNRPGEVDLPGNDVAFDRDNNLAIAAPGPADDTVTVYDAVMAVKWSVPGRQVAFTRTGELYVESSQAGGIVTRKYDATGSLLASAATPLGFVTPEGGMLVPGPAANNFTIRDAAMNVVASPTLSGPYGGPFGGCLGASTTQISVAVGNANDGQLAYDRFTSDGTYLDTKVTNDFNCHQVPDWNGGVVQSAWHPLELTASHAGFFIDDLSHGFDVTPFGAAVDTAGNLYWTYGLDSGITFGPQGGLLKKYTPPGDQPVWMVSRPYGLANAGQVGLSPRKVMAAPDGRVAWVVDWYGPFGLAGQVIEIFPP